MHKVAHLYTDPSCNILESWDFFPFDEWEIISHYNLNFHFSYCINKLEHLFMWLQVICIFFFWEFSVCLASVSGKIVALFSSSFESSHFVRKVRIFIFLIRLQFGSTVCEVLRLQLGSMVYEVLFWFMSFLSYKAFYNYVLLVYLKAYRFEVID